MIADKNRYLLAIIPPSPIFDQALDYKHYFKDRYQSKASLNSPPHITLHMPFEWKDSKEVYLVEAFQKISFAFTAVKVRLKNFDCFSPRVIFIRVIPSEELIVLQHNMRQFCKKELGLFNADYKDIPLNPHVTLAFRDLKKSKFALAWEEFKDNKYEREFIVDKISLLKFVETKWNVM